MTSILSHITFSVAVALSLGRTFSGAETPSDVSLILGPTPKAMRKRH